MSAKTCSKTSPLSTRCLSLRAKNNALSKSCKVFLNDQGPIPSEHWLIVFRLGWWMVKQTAVAAPYLVFFFNSKLRNNSGDLNDGFLTRYYTERTKRALKIRSSCLPFGLRPTTCRRASWDEMDFGRVTPRANLLRHELSA